MMNFWEELTVLTFFQLFVLSGEGSKGKGKQSEGWVSGCRGHAVVRIGPGELWRKEKAIKEGARRAEGRNEHGKS